MSKQQEPTYWIRVEVSQPRDNKCADKEHDKVGSFVSMLLSSSEERGFYITNYKQEPYLFSIDLIKICPDEQDKDVEEFLHFLAERIQSNHWPVKISLKKFPEPDQA